MNRVRDIFIKILHPHKKSVYFLSILSFVVLIYVFATNNQENMLAYVIYGMSAYSLIIWMVHVPILLHSLKQCIMKSALIKALHKTKLGRKYMYDMSFRGSISIYQGMIANLVYAVFRVITGVIYASVWFISMAVYYMALVCLKIYLIRKYRHSRGKNMQYEYMCYKNMAYMLLILDIPMAGIIIQMVVTNIGFYYPGTLIYLSALYTFYVMILSIVNIVKYRKVGSPILSASKILNFVSAMISILCLQTSMISRFSVNGELYRRQMNAITGGCIYAIVIIVVFYMLLRVKKMQGMVKYNEQK